jgi:NADPH:quinone reductase-like Zn-dependent oxidoreductase
MADALAMVLREAKGHLILEERAVPEPRLGEIVVKLAATSVNFHDILNIEGFYQGLPYPRVPFSDGCGAIVAVGEGVKGFAVGDRVMPCFYPNWIGGPITQLARSEILGDHRDGCLQTHLRMDHRLFVRAPDHLSDVEAATLGCAGLTAWRSVVVNAQIKPGETVVVEGTGGVSLFALGYAKLCGARVIITSSSDEKLERARGLGADETINYRKTPEWGREVIKLTEGRGADLVVDIGGPDTFPHAVHAAAVGGHISVIGARTGVGRDPEFPVRTVMAKNVTVRGLSVGNRAHFEDMCRAVAQAKFHPPVGQVLDFRQAEEALALMEKQVHFGKLVLSITP